MHYYLIRLTLALQLSSIQVFFQIASFVKFYFIPPNPIFQDRLSILAALLVRLRLVGISVPGVIYWVTLWCLCCAGTENCQNKCRKICQLLVHRIPKHQQCLAETETLFIEKATKICIQSLEQHLPTLVRECSNEKTNQKANLSVIQGGNKECAQRFNSLEPNFSFLAKLV